MRGIWSRFSICLLVVLWASAAIAAPTEIKIFLNTDTNQTTGCLVATASGPIEGVEQIFTTTFDTVGSGLQVTGITRQVCVDPVANSFGSAETIDAGGWAVGDSGGGNLLLETHAPLSAIGTGPFALAFTAASASTGDAIVRQPNGSEILYPSTTPGPRRRAVGGVGLPRIIVLDGVGTDWNGLSPHRAEGAGIGSPALSLGRIYVFEGVSDLFFRFDILSNPNAPHANPDLFSLLRGGVLNVAPPGVLANDTDPAGRPLTASLVTGPQHGVLILNANGGFNYSNDGSNAPVDSFVYKASNGSSDSNAALVTLTIINGTAPVITSANNTTFTVGIAGSFQITTSGSPTPTLSESGSLPTGVTFTANGNGTGTLAGTPLSGTAGIYTITFSASNSAGTATQTFTLTVNGPPTITSANTTTFPIGINSSFTVTASGFPAPTISESGALPNGVSYNPITHVLSGTPGAGAAGSYPITFTATNAAGSSPAQNFTLIVNCPVITVTNPTTANGVISAPFSQAFTQSGANGGATFTTASALPNGITLGTDGKLSGTPTQFGTFPITVTVTDGSGCTGTGPTYNLVISCQTITVTNPGVTTGTVDAAFNQTFTQSGAIGTATFTLASGTLPTGLTLATTGILSGTPGQTGTFPITVKVTDSNGCSGTGPTYNLVIACQTITVTNPGVTTGTVDAAFNQTFTQSGAIGTATFTLASGTLPTGLTLATTGILSGTPGQTGTFPITVKVTDSNGCSGTGPTYNLVIACQTITVTNPATTLGTFNTAFSQTFTQTGVGTHTPAVFTINSGSLPGGLSLSTAGVLSGTPTQTGSFSITVKVTDANGCFGTGPTYNLQIQPKLVNDSYTSVGNTQLFVTGIAGAPTTPAVQSGTTILGNDSADVAIALTTVTNAVTTSGGLITIDSAGRILYTPPVGISGINVDSYTYTGTSNSVSATATIFFTLNNLVWYVDNAFAGTHDGRSNTPFSNLGSGVGNLGGVTTNNGDFIYVFKGSSPGTPTSGSYAFKPSQQLIGAGATLSVGGLLTVAGNVANTPTLSGSLTLSTNNTLTGFNMNTAADAITGSGITTGTTTVSGVTITASGGAKGVNLSSGNAGSTFNFTNLNITTAGGNGFNATGGGTVNVTGAANTISSTTGTALNVVNTTIGASGLNFQSITANGSSNNAGIVLDNTGSTGGLTVSGNGGTCTSSGTCTGGTISNKTGGDILLGTDAGGQTNPTPSATNGCGIFLRNTSNPSFTNMQLNDFTNFAIYGNNVTGFTLTNSNINGVNGSNNAGDREEDSIRFDNLLTSVAFPTATISNSSISGGNTENIRIENVSGTLNRINILNNTFGFVSATQGNHNVLLIGYNSAILNVTFQDNTVLGARSELFETAADLNSTMDVVVRHNNFQNNQALVSGGGGVAIRGDSAGTAATVTFDISCNKISGSNTTAFFVDKGNGSGNYSGSIINNKIGLTGVNASGASNNGDDIFVREAGGGTLTVLIRDNDIRQFTNSGIALQNNSGSSTMNASIFNNTIAEASAASGGAFALIDVENGATGTDTSTTNVVIGSATVGGNKNNLTHDATIATDVELSNFGAATHLNLSTNGSASGTPAGVIADDNVGTPSVDTSGGSGTTTLVSTLPTVPPTPATCTVVP